MTLVSRLFAGYLLRRLAARPPRGARAPYPTAFGRGGGRRSRGRFGFFGPFPTYSTRTRRGSRVTVSGCCLPLALAPFAAAAGVAALIRRR